MVVELEAGLHLYQIRVWGDGSGDWRWTRSIDDVVCGDVFLIDGQSNSVARDYHNERRGTWNVRPLCGLMDRR